MADIRSNELYNALKRLNRQIYRYAHQAMPPKAGLHRGQIHLLFLISRNDGVIQRDLADSMDIRPSSLTEMLIKLEQEAFVVRKQDEKDQRIMHIHLTAKGKAAVKGFTEANAKLTAAIFNCLMAEEIEKMLELVQKISENLETLDNPDSGTGNGRGRQPHGHHPHHHWD
ncbi:MarR family winged helix-turn-helix transcriptional regulator [Sporomusa termitida]|uniref:Transcriptional regulator SlyA n=1 Tax=Sporomusa termitida TaxID=2377 RepID=A0A517DV64_9FIRM|nr:MarR family transcriptional regulator [Sporomusa termitida]QDR81218.1 Transcriptional regulator SlyA [Sporomusa termitida]